MQLMMPRYFFLVYFIVEVFILFAVIRWLGFLNTLLLLILTTVLGSWIVRTLGFQHLQRQGWHQHLPKRLLAGVLLIIPGFLTDFIGLLLLILPMKGDFSRFFSHSKSANSPASDHNKTQKGDVIEGEYWRDDK